MKPKKDITHFSNQELFTIIFGCEGEKVYTNYKTCYTLSDCKAAGISFKNALKLTAIKAIPSRFDNFKIEKISSSRDIFNLFKDYFFNIPYEEFWCVFLSRSNRILEKERISQGGISGTVIDTRIILKRAINLYATGIILVHNHPSGNNQPSEPDKKITEKINIAAAHMEINILDHIIITDNQFFSFADEGLI